MATKLTKLDISRIEECHPILQKLWYACAQDKECPPFLIVDGARTIAEQKRNVAKGASSGDVANVTLFVDYISGSITWPTGTAFPGGLSTMVAGSVSMVQIVVPALSVDGLTSQGQQVFTQSADQCRSTAPASSPGFLQHGTLI